MWAEHQKRIVAALPPLSDEQNRKLTQLAMRRIK